jgi:SAM-dependent methyltransferase
LTGQGGSTSRRPSADNWRQRWFGPVCDWLHRPDPATYYQGEDWLVMQMINRHDLPRDWRVLEIGCGDGTSTRRLAQRFDQVIGLEINPARLAVQPDDPAVYLIGDGQRPPLAKHSVDLIVSVAVFEHLPDPEGTMRRLTELLRAGGAMLHFMPHWHWKLLQLGLFFPDKLRKELRGLSRALAGRKRPKTSKYHQGRETNNPMRSTRRRWYHHLVPRIHGEADSHWAEARAWTDQRWRALYEQAGLEVVDVMAAPFHSPYGFGLKRMARLGRTVGLTSARLWLVRRRGGS